MKSALPLLAGAAALLLMSGKKKKTGGTVEDTVEPPMDSDDEDTDTGDGPESDDDAGYGKVASGIRKDRIGSHSWRIVYADDGYHAEVMAGPGRLAPVQMEVGLAASLKAAKELLRDHFNQAILDAGHPESEFLDDPAPKSIGSFQVR